MVNHIRRMLSIIREAEDCASHPKKKKSLLGALRWETSGASGTDATNSRSGSLCDRLRWLAVVVMVWPRAMSGRSSG